MKKMAGIIMMVLGVALLVSGYTVFQSSKGEKNSVDNTETNTAVTNEEKGAAFEGYIVKMFSKKYYTLKDWTSDKIIDGVYAEANQNPDLTVEYNYKEKTYPFAVECKYRKSFFKGEIEFSYPQQLERYRAFEKERKMPVFIAIGVGGQPDNPGSLFIIPLKDIQTHILTRKELAPYTKDPASTFYFNYTKQTLD